MTEIIVMIVKDNKAMARQAKTSIAKKNENCTDVKKTKGQNKLIWISLLALPLKNLHPLIVPLKIVNLYFLQKFHQFSINTYFDLSALLSKKSQFCFITGSCSRPVYTQKILASIWFALHGFYIEK